MTPRARIPIVGLLSLLLQATPPGTAQEPTSLQCRLSLADTQFMRDQPIGCYLVVANVGDRLRTIPRPVIDQLGFAVAGPAGTAGLSATATGTEPPGSPDREVPLRPHCSIRINLGSIRILGAGGADAPLPTGEYRVSPSWNEPATGQTLGEIVGASLELVEYPLRVALLSDHPVHRRGEPVVLTIRLQNDGKTPVRFLNCFLPYANHFLLSVNPLEPPPVSVPRAETMLALVTPDAGDGWMTLLPGESLSVEFDAGKEFGAPGRHSVRATYPRRILIRPEAGKPRYTKQYRWHSPPIPLVILPAE